MEDRNYLKRGEQTYSQAQKKLKPGFFSRLGSSKSQRMDQASELFKQAANFFRLGKNCNLQSDQKAAQSFMRCAQCSPQDSAQYYAQAGKVLRKDNPVQAIQYYNQAVQVMSSAGRISMAARLRKQIAQMQEQDGAYSLAADSYRHAAQLFQLDNSDSTANTCKLKVAELSTFDNLSSNSIIQGIKIYQEVAGRYLMHNLTKYSAKDCYFKAAMLYLANQDTVGCQNAMNMYSNRDPSFQTSRESGLIRDLMGALRNNDINEFETALYNFNRITSLDRWKTQVFLKVKEQLTRQEAFDFAQIIVKWDVLVQRKRKKQVTRF